MKTNGKVLTEKEVLWTLMTYGVCDFCRRNELLFNGACGVCRQAVEELNDA